MRPAACRIAVVFIAGTGCGPSPAAHAAGELSLQLGTVADPYNAESAFVPLSDGQDVTLTAGAQGGFHVWMKFRVGGQPRDLTMLKTARRTSDGQLVLRTSGTTVSIGSPGATGTWELPVATPMFMCPSPIGIKVIDTPIRYEINLTAPDGTSVASSEVTLNPHCPSSPPDSASFCEAICKG